LEHESHEWDTNETNNEARRLELPMNADLDKEEQKKEKETFLSTDSHGFSRIWGEEKKKKRRS
jgi:hypothetical protein